MEQIKKEKLKLEILTPTYIGGAEDKNLTNKDYYLNLENNTINIIDTAKLMKYLIDNKKEQKFVECINYSKKMNEILDIIVGKENKESVVKEKIKIESIVYEKNKKNQNNQMNLNNINMFIKNIDNEPYIPASSIKGVITSAIAFNYIKKNQDKFRDYKERISQNIGNSRELKKIWNEIQSKIFKEYKEDTSKNIKWTNDLRRYISVSDSIVTKEKNTMITAKEDFSTNHEKIKKLPIYREYLVGGNIFEFEMLINYDKLKRLGINSIEDILEMLQNYTKVCIEIEEQLVKKARNNNIEIFRTSNENKPNVILGGGSGYYSKTLLTAFFTNNNELKNLVKRTLNKKHEHMQKDTIISPRTLKLAKYNSNYYIVGMGKIFSV